MPAPRPLLCFLRPSGGLFAVQSKNSNTSVEYVTVTLSYTTRTARRETEGKEGQGMTLRSGPQGRIGTYDDQPGTNDTTLDFSGGTLTTAEKVTALVEFGLADDRDEALAMLVDMGEADEDEDEGPDNG
jgi:hypothetical protein